MYKCRSINGTNNISGKNIARIRKNHVPKMSQRMLADKLQLEGLIVDKNAIQRMEAGKRFITDIELKCIAQTLRVSYDELLQEDDSEIG